MRATIKQLEAQIEYLNKITGSPATPYKREDGRTVAQIGNFHLNQSYGGYGLHRMANDGGGVTDRHIYGLHTKNELSELLSAFINGVELGKVQA